MATTPQKPATSVPPPAPTGNHPAVGGGHVTKTGEHAEHAGPRPIIGVKGEPIEDGERDPDTIAEEQRKRSDEMAAKGVDKWKEEHDERTPEERAEILKAAGAEPQKRVEGHKAS